MRFLAASLLALALVFGPVPLSANSEFPSDDSGRDRVGIDYDEIMARGFILLGVYRDFPPYSYRAGGTLQGVDVDLGHLIAERLGVEPRFAELTADETVEHDLRNYVWRGHYMGAPIVNVMMRIPYNRELDIRVELAALTGQYANERLAIAYSLAEFPDGGPTPGYFQTDKVAVENHTLADFYLTGLNRGQLIPNIRRTRSLEAARALLFAGDVSAVMGPRAQLEHDLPEGFAVHTPPLPGLAHAEWPIGIATQFYTARMLAYEVDDIVRAAVEDGSVAAIYAKYGLTYTLPSW